MRQKFILFAILFLSCFSLKADSLGYADANCENVVITDSIRERYNLDAIDTLMNKLSQKLNGVVIIAVRDTVLVRETYGERRLTGEPPCKNPSQSNAITENTLFDLASISKQFTAAAILKLHQQNLLNIEDNVSKYLPDFPYKDVTIKHLLTHTSGIPEYFKFKYPLFDSVSFISNEHLMRVLKKQPVAKTFPTGKRFEYVNTNYAILAYLVEIVSKTSFEQFVHENIFAPAEMNDTYFFTEIVGIDGKNGAKYPNVTPSSEDNNVKPVKDFENIVAYGHKQKLKFAKYDRMNGILGDKGIYTTANDLLRWANAYFIDYKVLPKELVELASQQQNDLSNGIIPNNIYGYGLRIEQNPSHGKLVYHGGLWNGFQNLFIYRPADNVIIIFLSNYYNRSHAGYSDKILNAIDRIEVGEEQQK